MELRKRRGLMIALILVTIGIPTVFLVIRLLLHAFAPHSYGPAGGYDIFTGLVAGVLYVFGFIVAATLGATAGSVDLTEGMFRHLVVTGRSRLALYLARIPAGLAIIVPLVAVGFTIVCAVCVFAAPTQLNYQGVNVPAGLSRAGLESWAADHPDEVICNFPTSTATDRPLRSARVLNAVPCGTAPAAVGRIIKGPPGRTGPAATPPGPDQGRGRPDRRTGLRRLLQDFLVPVDLADDQDRAVDRARGDRRVHRRSRARVAARAANGRGDPDDRARDRPHADPLPGAHPPPDQPPARRGRPGRGPPGTGRTGLRVRRWRRPRRGQRAHPCWSRRSTTVAVCVIVAWLVGWTVLGAWRMMTRDA